MEANKVWWKGNLEQGGERKTGRIYAIKIKTKAKTEREKEKCKIVKMHKKMN